MEYAVIGTGYWGQNHVRVAAELLDENVLDSVLICDIDEERASELGAQYGLEHTTDFETLPKRDIDAATLATPSTTHHQIATHLLEHGIDVMVEKPLALSSDEAWEIVDTAEQNERTLAVGHIFRHHPALNELKKRIDRGELGEIKHLTTSRFSFRVPRDTTGVLYSLAVHDIDIYNYLLERDPTQLFCNTDSFIRDNIAETANLVLKYGDVSGVINESWQIPVFGKRRDLVVVGTERSAYIDYLEDTTLELYDSRVHESNGSYQTAQEGSTVYEAESVEPLKAEVLDFLKSSRTDTEPRATGNVGAKTVEILEAAHEAADEHQVIKL